MKSSLLDFALAHKRIVSFGMLCALGSGFGQTFFISLSVPGAGADFGLGKAAFGSLYGGATLASAFFMPLVGGFIDRVSLKVFVAGVMATVALSALLMFWSPSLAIFAVALFGIRFSGQGLMSHTASTTMSRVFSQNRGKALGIASLGYPASEAIFPLLFTWATLTWGWRGGWLLSGASIVLLLGPLAFFLLLPFDTHPLRFRMEEVKMERPHSSKMGQPQVPLAWTRREVVMNPRVWLLLPFWMSAPFFLTGLFFHQMALTDEKGWTAVLLASAFVAFAAGRALTSFMVGPLIDRFGARRLLLFTMLPLALGFAILGLGQSGLSIWLYLGLSGVAVGLGGNTKAAYLAEQFGVRHLGAIRSTLMMVMIFATAASPPIFGLLLERGFLLSHLALGGTGFILVALFPAGIGLVMLGRAR
jgi:MFS family permease